MVQPSYLAPAHGQPAYPVQPPIQSPIPDQPSHVIQAAYPVVSMEQPAYQALPLERVPYSGKLLTPSRQLNMQPS